MQVLIDAEYFDVEKWRGEEVEYYQMKKIDS